MYRHPSRSTAPAAVPPSSSSTRPPTASTISQYQSGHVAMKYAPSWELVQSTLFVGEVVVLTRSSTHAYRSAICWTAAAASASRLKNNATTSTYSALFSTPSSCVSDMAYVVAASAVCGADHSSAITTSTSASSEGVISNVVGSYACTRLPSSQYSRRRHADDTYCSTSDVYAATDRRSPSISAYGKYVVLVTAILRTGTATKWSASIAGSGVPHWYKANVSFRSLFRNTLYVPKYSTSHSSE
mmetsp:Transcript_12910/g.38987  ORF Transcript_12910/g.38987 Transcript_12910/m.38987 type:complete len:243 (+) Transcript_12910:3761-4489(+)